LIHPKNRLAKKWLLQPFGFAEGFFLPGLLARIDQIKFGIVKDKAHVAKGNSSRFKIQGDKGKGGR